MSRTWWALTRVLGGVAILAALVWRVGTGPFLDGLRLVDAPSLLFAAAVTLLTTTCCAWRWTLVARGLGVGMPLGPAVAAYYRSQLINSTLPGGILGDVHRGVVHGRAAGDVGRGLRGVVWERLAGQVVLGAVALSLLWTLPSPAHRTVHSLAPLLVVVGVPLLAVVVLGAARSGLLTRRVAPGVLLASVVAVAGHAATFLVAARTAGVDASASTLLPIAVLALLAMSVPVNVAGWGPREGVAAWAFAAAGLGADQGVATAVVYGVMSLVATLPGLVVLAGARGSVRAASVAEGVAHG
jgi:uncharacterized membrane protein YbhN (UPF0104 family)